MPIASRTFRVFVSSTFEDLQQERNALQREVFPALRELCLLGGCRFQAIDLRWGVRGEAALDQRTMEICLTEIERCQRTRIRPNFVILLGDRYGWRPLAARVEAREFEAVRRHIADPADGELADAWYGLDENADPPEYVLVPRAGEFTDAKYWDPVEVRLHRALRVAARAAGLPEEALVKYEASATHQEILKGLGRTPAESEHVFAFFRAGDQANQDPDLRKLKAFLRERLGENAVAYEAGDMPKLCRQVAGRLERAIQGEIAGFESHAAVLEIDAHNAFAQDRALHFAGRQSELDAIAGYVRGEDRRPLVLTGVSGSGRSAVMAKASADAAAAHSQAVVIRRFIGATPESSSGAGLLHSLCLQISQEYGRVEETPSGYEPLAASFQDRLGLATAERPLVVFVDALDQLAQDDPAARAAWLPEELAANARVVVSTTQATDSLREARTLELPLLPVEDADQALSRLLQGAGRTLAGEQRAWLLEHFSRCGLPLYLKLAFDEARRWRSFTSDKEWRLGEKLAGIIDTLLERLQRESNHGPVMTARSLGYLAAARHGLTEDEMLDVLSADPEVWDDFNLRANHKPPEQRLPVVVWSRFYFDLEPYLSERTAAGGTTMVFYHRQVGDAAKSRYLSGGDGLRAHGALAAYFRQKADPAGDGTWSGHHARAVTELPFHVFSSGATAELATVLGDGAFAGAKTAAGAVYDLLHDYETAIASFFSGGPEHLRLSQMSGILGRYAHGLSRYPECGLQQLLLGVAALAAPDPRLKTQEASLTKRHFEDGTLKVRSLVPEHLARGVLQIPLDRNRVVENFHSTHRGILLRYRGGEWVELSQDLNVTARGLTGASRVPLGAAGGAMVALCSANVVQVWPRWPAGRPKIRRCPAPITAAACSADGRFLAIGCQDGSFLLHDPQRADPAPVVSGRLDAPVVAAWFHTNSDATMVTADGCVHRVRCESDAIRSTKRAAEECRLACPAGGETACLLSQESRLTVFGPDGASIWEVTLPERVYSLAAAPATADSGATVLAGLETGMLQTIDGETGELRDGIKVSQRALQRLEMAVGADSVICRDAAYFVFLASLSSKPSAAEFRPWPSYKHLLAARWNEQGKCLETLTPDGDRASIQRTDGSPDTEWRLSQPDKIDGPLDDARILPDGSVVALHRESDESQVWRHSPDRNGGLRSHCLLKGRSSRNAGPRYIHVFEVSRRGNAYALMGAADGHQYFCRGRLGSRFMWPRWVFWKREIDEIALSDRGETAVITQSRGSGIERPPARILICRGRAHKLLDDGWAGGVRGMQRGLARALWGVSISDDGRRIAAVDTSHNLWAFDFDPRIPDAPPKGRILFGDIVACSISASGHLCLALQLDSTIRLLSLDKSGTDATVAVLLLPGQAHYMNLDETGRRIVVSGENFIQAVLFQWPGENSGAGAHQ